jgi:hypothetical protein
MPVTPLCWSSKIGGFATHPRSACYHSSGLNGSGCDDRCHELVGDSESEPAQQNSLHVREASLEGIIIRHGVPFPVGIWGRNFSLPAAESHVGRRFPDLAPEGPGEPCLGYTLYVGGQTSTPAAMGLAPSFTPTRSLFPVDSTLGTSLCGKLYVFRQGVKETRTQMFSLVLKSSVLVANGLSSGSHT